MKILIVDDISEDRQLLRYIVERQGHKAIEAENGQEALVLAAAQRPDLIISDALMPVMDGFQFLRRVKADKALQSILFIFYSATYHGEKDMELALSLGADAFIVKPKEPKKLWEEVETVIRCRPKKIAPRQLVQEEEEYLRRYSEIVAAKLEQKVRELENAQWQRDRQEQLRQQAEATLRNREEQLRHAQKLEALGTLASGVAHDFNNVLSIIIGYGGLMRTHLANGEPARAYLQGILAAAERATSLTRSLLIFSRKQPAEFKPADLNEVVRSMKKMIVRLIGEDIEMIVNLLHEPLLVMGDYGQLEQVVMNFATNARDAMPDGGLLTIATEVFAIDEDFVRVHGTGKPGRYALLSVSDTGLGMDEKTRERIFEPFFTTKEVGKGTGLGLAIVYGIVQQHNGYISCCSEKDKGTTFKVYLPLAREESLARKVADLPEIQGGTETILVADDDEDVRQIMREMLECYGYTVIEARDGVETVNTFLANRDKVALLLLDVIMPGKGGREAFTEIRTVCPGIRVLFTSGYPEEVLMRKKILEEGIELLQKPVKHRDLLVRIRAVLDREQQR